MHDQSLTQSAANLFGAPPPLKVVVLCPLEFERRCFRRYAKLPAVTIGPGANGVRRAFANRAHWPYPNPSLIILVGTAGALNSKFTASSDAVIREVRSLDGRALHSGVDARAHATVVESPTIVASVEDKRALHSASGADLVDMESFTFATFAQNAGLRWAIVRGVSDDANSALPTQCQRFTDARGRSRIGQIFAAIARDPSLLVTLATLGKISHSAMRNAAFTADALGCIDAIDLCSATHPLLLYGGSFDPPHLRHASMLGEAMHALHAPCALVVPAAMNPLKAATPPASSEARLAMCRATFTEEHTATAPEVRISEFELQRAAPSYTIDTVRAMLAQRPHLRGSLRMLLGSDAIRNIAAWKSWRELLTLAPPAIVLRPPDDAASVAQFLHEFAQKEGFPDAPSWLLPLSAVDHASSTIREMLLKGQRPEGLADGTWREITARGLYGIVQ